MAVVPDFLIKRVYKKGSLRSCDEGIEFDLKMSWVRGLSADLNMFKLTITNLQKTLFALLRRE